MPGGSDTARSPRVRKRSFRNLVRAADHTRVIQKHKVYPFSKGKGKHDSGPESGIYAVRSYAGILSADLVANQATLTQETLDGFVNALKVTETGVPGQAQIIVVTKIGRKYRLDYEYQTNGLAAAAEIIVYDGDVRGFGASEPGQIVTTEDLATLSDWSARESLTFTAAGAITTIGMEGKTNPGYYRYLQVTPL